MGRYSGEPQVCVTSVWLGVVSTVCGKPKVIGKVYGDHDAVAGQWP